MLQLIETICIDNGIFERISLHEERMNRSRKELFGLTDSLPLMSYLSIPEEFKNIKTKCRVTYGEEIVQIDFEPYKNKVIRSLKIIPDDYIEYRFKYKNRDSLNRLANLKGNADEILIVKGGQITDTSFSNILFLKDGTWYTPEFPLLKGTRREHYLRTGRIREMNILENHLHLFEEARLINSMRSIEESEPIFIANIY